MAHDLKLIRNSEDDHFAHFGEQSAEPGVCSYLVNLPEHIRTSTRGFDRVPRYPTRSSALQCIHTCIPYEAKVGRVGYPAWVDRRR